MSQGDGLTLLELKVPLMTLKVFGYRNGGSVADGAMTGPDRCGSSSPKASALFLLDVQLPCGAVTTVTIDSETFEKHVRQAIEGNFRPSEDLEDPEGATVVRAEDDS